MNVNDPQPVSAARYECVAILLHWLIGLALLAEIAFGFLLDDIAPRNTPARAGVINLHKSFGIVLGLLIVLRLAWRLAHAPPPLPHALPRWERQAARLNHWLMYALMLLVPLSGYVASNFSKYGVNFFGIALAPWGPQAPAVYAFFNTMHVLGSWLLSALVALHIAAALKHALIDRDGSLARIWPPARR